MEWCFYIVDHPFLMSNQGSMLTHLGGFRLLRACVACERIRLYSQWKHWICWVQLLGLLLGHRLDGSLEGSSGS